jgi:hypothetical protein
MFEIGLFRSQAETCLPRGSDPTVSPGSLPRGLQPAPCPTARPSAVKIAVDSGASFPAHGVGVRAVTGAEYGAAVVSGRWPRHATLRRDPILLRRSATRPTNSSRRLEI